MEGMWAEKQRPVFGVPADSSQQRVRSSEQRLSLLSLPEEAAREGCEVQTEMDHDRISDEEQQVACSQFRMGCSSYLQQMENACHMALAFSFAGDVTV